MLVKWLGLFPPLLGLSYGIDAATRALLSTNLWLVTDSGTLLLWFKLLCVTAILVPLLNYVITPLMDSLFHGFRYAGINEDPDTISA